VFHTWQNGRHSGSVHATYMLYGIRKTDQTNGHSQQDGDVEMTSSPPEIESALDDGPVITLSLVAEESLKGWTGLIRALTSGSLADPLTDVLLQYEKVNSIHIYSLGTHPVKVRSARLACGLRLTNITAGSEFAC
jgi:DNA polymerase delta subunit 3